MTNTPEIAIVGLGNVGQHLATKLSNLGYPVKWLISSSGKKGQSIAQNIGATLLDDIAFLKDQKPLVFLCVPDAAIESVAACIHPDASVVHCSGATPLLTEKKSTGVLYMFQTFSHNVSIKWNGIPIFVESNSPMLEKQLMEIGQRMSGRVETKDSAQRNIIHIAGVFGANFVNHILYLSQLVLQKGDTSFEVMQALLEETIRKAIMHGPANVQTGPAKRGDQHVIESHLKILSSDPDLADIYRKLSESITKTYLT